MGWVGLVLFCLFGLGWVWLGWVGFGYLDRFAMSVLFFVCDVFDILVEFEFRAKSSSFFPSKGELSYDYF